MYSLYLDESLSRNNFVIFGGVAIKDELENDIRKDLNKLKLDNDISPDIEIKWNYHQTQKEALKHLKKDLSLEEHRKLKNNILQIIENSDDNNILVFLYILPWEIYKSNGWRSYEFAFNILLKRFNTFLQTQRDLGVVYIDELSGISGADLDSGNIVDLGNSAIWQYLKVYILNIFQDGTGRVFPDSICNIYPQINSSLCAGSQLTDILLGITRYYVCEDNSTGKILFQRLIPYIPRNFVTPRGEIACLNYGLNLYPRRDLNLPTSKLSKLKAKLNLDFNII